MSAQQAIRGDALAPGWRGHPASRSGRLSLRELIRAGSFDARTAALCLAVLERHGSLLVAGQAQGAGKTTTLSALVERLPPSIHREPLLGSQETFAFLERAVPRETLLLVNELSPHLPIYLWGRRAIRALSLVGLGFALAATLHADGALEAVELLTEDLGAPAADVARIDLVATVRVFSARGRAPVRRLVALDALGPDGASGVRVTPLVTYDPRADTLQHHDLTQRAVADPAVVAAHATRLARETSAGAMTR